jgi:predicted pyridoxine 5'-phosphate oxidase superfamily flavin-nucleotide-binding protein
MERYYDIAFGDAVRRRQRARGSFEGYQEADAGPAPTGLGDDEIAFLAGRDSFYLASVGTDGWPYVQHRGGPAGFVKVIDATHIAWADRVGNRQFVSAGNLDDDGRIAIIAVDYPNRQRLKVFGRARFDAEPSDADLAELGLEGRMEGAVMVEVIAFDWNCPKFITPRFTPDEIDRIIEPLINRLRERETVLEDHGLPDPGAGRPPGTP